MKEDKELFIDKGNGKMNFLIEGDNLSALKLLEKTHKGKIDLIYIDPPYNRGVDDFKYDDNYITKSDGYIHSKWISFMEVRLKIAHKLLHNAGAIFISIDDNEQANLKLLCDSIFGEQNDIAQITNVFSKMLEYTLKKSLKDRRQELTFAEKIVWLDSFDDMGNGNFNITFKSAKYNHVRNEINTETMEPLGTRKQRRDGDEEKTHLCIRLAQGQQRYLAVHESNYYGITINCIINYLNECFKRFNEETEEQYHYEVSYEIMPGDDFLTSLKEAKTISALTLTVYKDSLPNEFMLFAGRTSDIADDVEIKIKTPKKGGKFPDNLIKAYYEAMQGDGRIKRIKASGFF